jgi:hypothetical protein
MRQRLTLFFEVACWSTVESVAGRIEELKRERARAVDGSFNETNETERLEW